MEYVVLGGMFVTIMIYNFKSRRVGAIIGLITTIVAGIWGVAVYSQGGQMIVNDLYLEWWLYLLFILGWGAWNVILYKDAKKN